MEITEFDNEDVITTSNPNQKYFPEDDETPIVTNPLI